MDPRGFQNMARAAETNSKFFRDALASTGQFEVQQVRLNSATDEYVKKLKAQKVGFKEMWRERKSVAEAAYKEQLAMEKMFVRRGPASASHGKDVFDVSYARAYSEEVDTAGRRLSWFNEQLKSGSTQMVNWGKNTQWAGRQLTVGLTMPVAMFGAAAGVLAYQIDKEMTRIQKVYDTTADSVSSNTKDMMAVEKELAQVREDAMKTASSVAAQYGMTAKDTLNIQAELAATGKQGAELQSTTTEVARIATLGEIDHQTAIEATIALQSVFRMSNQELTESFNYMNSIENATSLSLNDFATAIPIAASSVKAFGGDVKEMGILLAAMKENGIGASEGANALKATMQRLGRPSKQIREEWAALTGTDITKLVDDSDGLVEVFTKIQAATANLDPDDQRKAFAGLFGSYQVSKMMALTKGMGELGQGVGQVSQAYRIAQQDSTEWAAVAKKESKDAAESVSGQWDRAFATIQIELAKMGTPFVELATTVVKQITKVLSMFNDLPDSTKKVVAIGVAFGAIAGPLLMIAGLFGNLLGNAGKGLAGLLTLTNKFTTSLNIASRDSRIATAAAAMQEAGYISQTKALTGLTASLKTYTAALRVANTASGASAAGIGAGGSPYRLTSGAKRQADIASRDRYQQSMMDKYKVQDENKKVYYANPMSADPDKSIGPMAAYQLAMADMHDDAKGMNKEMDDASGHSKKTAAATKAASTHMRGAAVASAAMGAGMLLTMTSADGMANDIGQFLLISSIVVPAATQLLGLMKGITIQSVATAVANKATTVQLYARSRVQAATSAVAAKNAATTAAATGRHAAGAHKAATATSKIATGMKVAGVATMGMMGPVGWILTAVTGIVFGIYKWSEHMKKVAAEQAAFHNSLNNGVHDWAKAMGLVRKEYEAIAGVQAGIENKEYYDRAKDAYASGDLKEFRTNFAGLDDAGKEMNVLRDHFMTLQTDYGLTTKKASDNIRALMEVAGFSAMEAEKAVDELMEKIGTVDEVDMPNVVLEQGDNFWGLDQGTKEAETAAKDVATAFVQAMTTANGTQGPKLMAALKEVVGKGWTAAWEDIQANGSNEMVDRFAEMGIDSGEALQKAISQAGGRENFLDQMFPDDGSTGFAMRRVELMEQLDELVGSAVEAEKQIVGAVSANDLSGLNDNVDNIDDLTNSLRGVALASKAWTETELDRYMSLLKNPPTSMPALEALAESGTELEKSLAALPPEQRKAYIEAINLARGLNKAGTAAAGVKGEAKGIEPILNNAAAAARRIAANMKFSQEDVAGIYKDAMDGVQTMIADDYRKARESQLDGQMESVKKQWDTRVDNVNADIERQKSALDAKWEKRRSGAETYWDNRIDAVERASEAEQKAEDARQKMFDAEMARIKRLTDMENTNIDFNMALNEGSLDEAAKIANDIQARSMTWAYEDAAKVSADRSEKKQDRLGKKQDRLEDAKDSAMEAMDKREEQEKAHLDRVSAMRAEAAERDRDVAIAAEEARIEKQKELLDEALRVFTSGTAADQKEMKRRMEQAGLSYEWFEKNVINKKGTKWGDYFGDEMEKGLLESSRELMNSNMWEAMGQSAIDDMAKSMGFAGIKQLMHFLKTGKMKDFDAASDATTSGNSAGRNRIKEDAAGTFHGGGEIAAGQHNRKGVARTLNGLHNSEVMVRARKGEYMVNERSYAKHKDTVEAINADTYDSRKDKGGIGGAGEGPVPFFAAAFARAIAQRTAQAIGAKVQKKQTRMARKASQQGSYYSGGAGAYGLPGVKPWVSEAANYLGGKYGVSNILGVGDRASNPTSDHPRGLAIDLMTGTNVSKGDAIAAEALKLQNVLDATYMVWNARIHSFDQRGWLPYTHPAGLTDDTSMHRDHVHISFSPTGNSGDLPGSASTIGPFVPGAGGRSAPTNTAALSQGLHPTNALDIAASKGAPVYAVADGRVTGSYDIRGYEERRRVYGQNTQDGYRSYGRVITMNHGDFNSIYAHMDQRNVSAGPNLVKGGSIIGRVGNTGNVQSSTGDGSHLHFGVTGASPYDFLQLSKGASYVNYDNTVANLHKGEGVLTEDLNSKLHRGIDRIETGDVSGYNNVTVNINGYNQNADVLTRKVVRAIAKDHARQPKTRTIT